MADPATFPASNSVLGGRIPLREQLVYSDLEKINISEFVLPSYFFITLFNSFFVLLFFIVFHLAAVVRNVPVCGTIREFWF